MKVTATRSDAYDLFHQGTLALAQAESNGIRIDTKYLRRTIDETGDRITSLDKQLQEDKVWEVWKRRFGSRANINSRPQLGVVLFEELGIEGGVYTEKTKDKKNKKERRWKVDEEVLEKIHLEFVENLVKVGKLKKLESTYLRGVLREVSSDGLLHPSFNLNTVITYRSSGSDPNFQNIPIRDPEIAELIRRAFIPRKGRYLVEIDFKGAEVCVSACYNHDPKLIEYVSDPTTDMHRDVAAQIFKLKTKQIQKPVRQTTKTNFVFAEFYGAWYKTCAEKIWYEIEKYKLTTDAGVSLYEHLADQGITERGACDPNEDSEPGTFERRIQDVEKDFWGKRFSVYAQWKKDWYQEYQSRGYFDMLTGFRCSGVMGKKEVCNYPVQGASFHCLLWSLIQLQNWLNRHDMKSLIIGQIHDSILLDVSKDELEDVTRYAVKVITKKLPEHYDWICVPITAEIEASNENWFKKKPLHQAV